MEQKQKAPQPKLVKARVLPSNSYGKAKAGEIVEVEEKELLLVKHCLISLEEEKRAKEYVASLPTKTDQARQELDGYRDMYRRQHQQLKKMEAERAVREAAEAQELAKKLHEA